jgi:CRP/FNR family cyclic AMP-dependent transcriptional regulator
LYDSRGAPYTSLRPDHVRRHVLEIPTNTPLQGTSAAQPAEVLPSLAADHELVRGGRIQTFRKGVVIVQEGDHGDTLFVILSGRVKVFATGDDEREIVLDIHGPGEFVGEMSLDGGPRSASVITLEATTCSVVTRGALREHIARNPDIAFEIISKLIRRARRATENVKNLALLDVYGRVTRLLNTLAVEQDGQRMIPERLTHQDIAERVGASREMVSRLMKDLSQGGYVEVRGRQIFLMKPLPPAW